MGENQLPKLSEIDVPLRAVVEAILTYQGDRHFNPFRLSVTIGEGLIGKCEKDAMDVSLDHPASLNHRCYTINHIWGHCDEEYPDISNIARIMKAGKPSPTYISWDFITFQQVPQTRRGYEELANLLLKLR